MTKKDGFEVLPYSDRGFKNNESYLAGEKRNSRSVNFQREEHKLWDRRQKPSMKNPVPRFVTFKRNAIFLSCDLGHSSENAANEDDDQSRGAEYECQCLFLPKGMLWGLGSSSSSTSAMLDSTFHRICGVLTGELMRENDIIRAEGSLYSTRKNKMATERGYDILKVEEFRMARNMMRCFG